MMPAMANAPAAIAIHSRSTHSTVPRVVSERCVLLPNPSTKRATNESSAETMSGREAD